MCLEIVFGGFFWKTAAKNANNFRNQELGKIMLWQNQMARVLRVSYCCLFVEVLKIGCEAFIVFAELKLTE